MKKETTVTSTENGMKTFSSSLNACLDLFFMIGASRNKSETEIQRMFASAFAEDQRVALLILAWARDARGGAGERRAFKICLKFLKEADYLNRIDLRQIPELGRWDDLFDLPVKQIEKILFEGLVEKKNGLLAKWLPRKKQYNNLRAKLCSIWNFTPKEYRDRVVELSRVVETQMCGNEWADINYSHVPSKANVKYNKAFLKHDEERRRGFLEKVKKGEVKINSSVAYPYDIVRMLIDMRSGEWQKPKENETALAMWNQLPNYLKESAIRLMVMADTSGSMGPFYSPGGLPLLISLSLALYISERTDGPFKDAFLTFSKTPELQYLKGNLYERLSQIQRINPANTDLEAAFDLVLTTAVKHKIKASEMPTHILIISDMEFDVAKGNMQWNALEMIKAGYQSHGYKMPQIVFWNVNSRQSNIPVRYNDKGVALISGASPAVITGVLKGKIDPVTVMMDTVDTEKYQKFLQA